MSVDKAFEEFTQNMQEYNASKTFAKEHDCGDEFEYFRALGFSQGYQAGQKTLSPKVRWVLLCVEKELIIAKWNECKGEVYTCNCCEQSCVIGETIKHSKGCIVKIIEKLLEAGE